MNGEGKYLCPICGADSLSTDFTDGFKWGRAYCNSCDCGGPEVRTGYDENLDAPWRVEARKQFVEVVNEHAAKRSPWVKTSDRLPTEADAGVDEEIVTIYDDGDTRMMGVDYWKCVALVPGRFPYWLPVPKLPEVEE
ncbi:MAG: hypothetical protein EOM54_14780 [Clostridia bacterium]|nr:hypothetical protein [Clostridia bacterium]